LVRLDGQRVLDTDAPLNCCESASIASTVWTREALGFLPTSDGTQTLGCLMAGKVDVRRVCWQEHAGVLHCLLMGAYPMGEHDLLMSYGLIIQEAIGGQRVCPVAHAFRQGRRWIFCDDGCHLHQPICAPLISQFGCPERFHCPFVRMH